MSVELPFPAYSMKAITLNSEETLLYDGKILKSQTISNQTPSKNKIYPTSNKISTNTKTLIFNSETDSFTEWLDLAYFFPESECQEIISGWDSYNGVLYFIYKHIHAEVAFETKFDMLAFDFKLRNSAVFYNLSEHLTDDFQKKIYDPVSIEFTEKELLINCRHLHVGTKLTQFSFPKNLIWDSKISSFSNRISFSKNDQKISKLIPSKKTHFCCNFSVGKNPFLFKKKSARSNSFLSISLQFHNSKREFRFDLSFLGAESLFLYDTRNFISKNILLPQKIQNVFEKVKSIFISDDLIFFSGGFMRLPTLLAKQISNFCFLFSISKNTWIFPDSLKSWGKKEIDWENNLRFVGDKLLRTRFEHQNHQIIIFDKKSIFLFRTINLI